MLTLDKAALHDISWKYVQQAVNRHNASSGNHAWFDAQLNSLRQISTGLGKTRSALEIPGCVEFVRGNAIYEEMCTVIDIHLESLRVDWAMANKGLWKTFVLSGQTFAERCTLYKLYHGMDCIVKTGGLPSPPPVVAAGSPLDIALTTETSAGNPGNVSAMWTIAFAKARHLGTPVSTSDLQARYDRMSNGTLRYGPQHAEYLSNWETYIQTIRGANISDISKYRLTDLYDKVLDFRRRFGVFLSCEAWLRKEISDSNCEDMVKDLGASMLSRSFDAWGTWHQFTCATAEDNTVYANFATRRAQLEPKGYFWAPHQTEPLVRSHPEQAEHLGFGSDRINLTGDWKFRGTVGSGSFGHAGLWVQISNDGRIMRRVVVKESYMQSTFDYAAFWSGELYNRVVKEAKIAMDLNSLPGSENIVETLAFAIYATLKMWRVYMEYYPHGDLEDTIRLDRSIPERQLWAIFDGLISALCFLRFGGLPGRQDIRHRIVQHRDIKPANVFLGAVQSVNWKGVPIPKLGDFGLATMEGDEDSSRPGIGTMRYAPPEQQKGVEDITKVTFASDLWSVGRIMLSLMNRERAGTVPFFTFVDEEDAPLFFNGIASVQGGIQGMYGSELCELVRSCVHKYSSNRPGADEVWNAMQSFKATMKTAEVDAGEATMVLVADRFLQFAPA